MAGRGHQLFEATVQERLDTGFDADSAMEVVRETEKRAF
jgi:hypothetical protein